MLQYGSYEKKEGDHALQEVVKDYTDCSIVNTERFPIILLKIVRTPNISKIVNGKLEGEDWEHCVYVCARAKKGGKYYFQQYNFPDSQEGLNEAEKKVEKILIDYGRNKIHHPKKWSLFKN